MDFFVNQFESKMINLSSNFEILKKTQLAFTEKCNSWKWEFHLYVFTENNASKNLWDNLRSIFDFYVKVRKNPSSVSIWRIFPPSIWWKLEVSRNNEEIYVKLQLLLFIAAAGKFQEIAPIRFHEFFLQTFMVSSVLW